MAEVSSRTTVTEDINPYELSIEKWNFVLRSNAILNGFIVNGSKDVVQRSRFPAFQLNQDIAEFTAFEIEDNSSINVSVLYSDLQSSVVNECFSTKDFEAVMKAGIFGFNLGGNIERAKASLQSSGSSQTTQSSRLYATYEFPRVVLFLDENTLDLSPLCTKALKAVCADPSPEAVVQFLEKFGHVYPKEVHLGGRLQAMKSLESVSGNSVSQKIDALKLEASAQFNPGFGRGTGNFQSADACGMFSNLSISSSSQLMAWEARGGDTTLSSNPSAWTPTVKASHNWRVIRRKEVIPLPDIIGALPEWSHIPSVFSKALEKTKPLPIPLSIPTSLPTPISKPLLKGPSRILRGHTTGVGAMAYSLDGKILAAAAYSIHLWDARSDTELRKVDQQFVRFMAFTPDSKMLAAARTTTIQLWDIQSGALRNTLTGHSDDITALAFSPDGQILASGSKDRTIRIWQGNSVIWVTLWTLRDLDEPYAMLFTPNSEMLWSLAYSESIYKWKIESGRRGEKVQWTHNGEQLREAGLSLLDTLNFSGNGALAATAFHKNRNIKVWDVDSRRQLQLFAGHEDTINAVTFSPDNRLLASVSRDNTAKLWDNESGSLLLSLSHSKWFTCAAFSPDGKTLAVATGAEVWLCDID